MSLRHPFGFLDGDRVVPAEVEDGETAVCPVNGCDDQLHVRGPSTSGTVRHFWHPGGGGEGGNHDTGGGGESATHKNYKSHAASALLNFFGDFVRESTTKEVFEQRIDVPDSDQYRLADALVTFQSSHHRYGKGVVIEVQHENKGKDIDTVTEEYLSAGYSVFWTDSETHYEPGRYLFDREQFDTEIVSVWPNAVPEIGDWQDIMYDMRCRRIRAQGGLEMEMPRMGDGGVEFEETLVSSQLEWSRQLLAMELGIETEPPSVERDVILPEEWFHDHREELKAAHSKGGDDYDLIRQLTPNNAPRRCGECGEDASLYLFLDGVVSKFVCWDHSPFEDDSGGKGAPA